MRNKLINIIPICLILSLLIFPVAASQNDYAENYDYLIPNLNYCRVEEELIDTVSYHICNSGVIDDILYASGDAVPAYCIESTESLKLVRERENAYDHSMSSDRYPESFLEITEKYDESFFADNVLAVAQAPIGANGEIVLKRIDYISSNQEELSIAIVIDYEEVFNDMRMGFVIIELPRKYYKGVLCAIGSPVDSLFYSDKNPQTGDSTMLLPAMGAMVVAAAGIVITKKRKK